MKRVALLKRHYSTNPLSDLASVLPVKTAVSSPAFLENSRWMNSLLLENDTILSRIAKGGGEKAVARHRAQNKLLARERIGKLLDPGSAFLELSPLAGFHLYGMILLLQAQKRDLAEQDVAG